MLLRNLHLKLTCNNMFNLVCADNQFTCNSGHCIPQYYLCDGYVDCIDGEDEEKQNCNGKYIQHLE